MRTPRSLLLLSSALLAVAGCLSACSTPATSAQDTGTGTASAAEPRAATPPVEQGAESGTQVDPPTEEGAELLEPAMSADPAVAAALATGKVTQVSFSGAWARADIATQFDGLIVVFRTTESGWEVVDAGVAGVGCQIVPPEDLAPLSLSC